VNLETLKEFYPDAVLPLDFIIRTIVGMEPEAVEKRFASFAQKFADNSRQTHFCACLRTISADTAPSIWKNSMNRLLPASTVTAWMVSLKMTARSTN